MFSSRIPRHRELNEWTRALRERRASPAPLFDLTETNPTRAGLAIDPAHLAALADPRGASYDPDPRGLRSARDAVCALYAEIGVRVDPDALVLTSGTSEAYAHVFRVLCEPGDAVLVPTPSYPLFEPLALAECARVVPYALRYDGRWFLDEESFAHALRSEPRVRATIVVQPNNPTGSCLTREELAFVRRVCADSGVAVISDEVFADFPWAPGVRALPSAHAADDAPLTFVLGGLSKSCGLPQMKLAWIAVSGGDARVRREALDGLEWLADLFLSVGTPVQLAAPALLAARGDFVRRVRARLQANLDTLAALARAHPETSLLAGDGGWSAVVRVPRTRSDDEWAMELLRRDVIVHPGHFYDFADEGHLVLSLLTAEEDMRSGTARFAESLL